MRILHAVFVVEIAEGGIDRLGAHDRAHVLVDLVAHGLAGDGAGIHQVMLDPDHVIAALAALLVQDALYGGHVLAW